MGLLQKVSYSGITDSTETSAAAKIAPLEKNPILSDCLKSL